MAIVGAFIFTGRCCGGPYDGRRLSLRYGTSTPVFEANGSVGRYTYERCGVFEWRGRDVS